jgi:hypothetical protein
MALICPTDLTGVNLGFTEFLDCSSLAINYDQLGTATLSFTVVASKQEPVNVTAYNNLTFGGVSFTGFVTGLEVRRIPGTIVYEHRYTVSATGCKV